jgi:hypothetical protein
MIDLCVVNKFCACDGNCRAAWQQNRGAPDQPDREGCTVAATTTDVATTARTADTAATVIVAANAASAARNAANAAVGACGVLGLASSAFARKRQDVCESVVVGVVAESKELVGPLGLGRRPPMLARLLKLGQPCSNRGELWPAVNRKVGPIDHTPKLCQLLFAAVPTSQFNRKFPND